MKPTTSRPCDRLRTLEMLQFPPSLAVTRSRVAAALAIFLAGFFALGTAAGAVRINEFLAINDGGLEDEDGDASDWIELFNSGDEAVDLTGWYLTDDASNLTKWSFPATNLGGLDYLVVFASDKNRLGRELHANFRLTGDGEYLALVRPDGVTIATEFAPAFPPQQSNVSYGFHGASETPRALFPPTPQAPNTEPAGPLVRELTTNPDPVPGPDEPIVVSARVQPNPAAVTSVVLQYRVMWEPVVRLAMSDLGEGIFRATIPSTAFEAGEMVRWYVTALDEEGNSTRAPRFLDPLNSPEYYGTVIADPRIATPLPVMERFVENPSRTESRAGTRCAFFYNGEFFDNVFTRIRGGTSTNWPKKSYKIEFNDGHHFRFREGVPRVDEINLNTTYTDKSYVRAVLAYEHQRDAGLPSPESFLVNFRQNGSFWNVAILVEQPDRDFLRRWGLDPDGAFYKAGTAPARYEPSTPLSFWEKKTRHEEDKSDLVDLLANLRKTGEPLETFLFDGVDLPTQVNYMATTCITQNIDGSDKNHYLYRDTEGSGEWAMLPWDIDLTFGPNALNTDVIVFDNPQASHPYIGARPHVLSGGKYNHFLETIVANPRTRAMLNRRIRTLIDEHLASGYFESRIDELVRQIARDVTLDKAKWGGSTHFPGATYSLRQATDRIKNEYIAPRIPYLTRTEGQAGSGLVLVAEDSPVSALVPVDGSLGDSWKDLAFDDSSWIDGAGPVGYERAPNNEFTPLLDIDLDSEALPPALRIDRDGDGQNENNSCYLRYEFEVADRDALTFLNLRVKHDDGFAAFLNGAEVAARNAPSSLLWNSEATAGNRDSEAVVFENIDITAFKNALRDGPNVLAVHALNFQSSSTDMLFACELSDSAADGGTGAGIPPPQPILPVVEFGSIEHNPASGNQDEEFIEVVNPNAYALDVSGWNLEGGVQHAMKGGTVIPARDSLYLTPNTAAFRARSTPPTGGQRLFLQGDYDGHLSNFGEPLVLKDKNGAIIAQTTTPDTPSDPQRFLVVSEIMYHPATAPEEEFIELLNISESVTLDLTGVTFTEGIAFDFTGSAITGLGPGERVLVVRSKEAFELRHGSGLPIAGEFADQSVLDNDGESVKLEDSSGSTIAEFRYNDALPWPTAPDGQGPSLVLVNPHARPDPSLPANWRSSIAHHGTPGGSDASTFPGVAGDDADRNGLDDLLDYAVGHVPGATDGLPSVSVQDGVVHVTYRENLAADDISFTPEWSTDLQTWLPLAEPFNRSALTPVGTRRTVEYSSDAPLLPAGGRLFIRLSVALRAGP